MKNIFKIASTTLLGALLPAILIAGNGERAGTGGATELLINPWARSAGFGGINTSMAKGVEAMNVNVGGLAYTKNTEVVFSRTTWLKGSDVNINAFGLSQKVGTSGGEIRHTEIRSDSTPSENGAKPEKHSEKDND